MARVSADWGVGASGREPQTNVIEFCPDADCGYSFIHRCEPRDKMAKSLTNHKTARGFVLIHMAPNSVDKTIFDFGI